MTTKNRGRIDDIWGQRTPYHTKWDPREDIYFSEEPDQWIQSACVLCSNGCGMEIGVKNGKIVGVKGRTDDRINLGRLGPKGLYGWQANNSSERLTTPLIKDNGDFREASWDEAMDLIVSKSKEFIKSYTGSSIGFYTSGQLFIEEYYTLGVIGKAGIGTPHMDGNTRLCTATAAAAFKETFGSDGQPGSYSDIDITDTILMVGHNPSNTQTVMWMRILDRLAGPNQPKLIVIDPRTTETAKMATVHLAPKVGTNVALLNGLIHLIIKSGKIDKKFIEEHTIGFEKLKETVEDWTPAKVKQVTGVTVESLTEAAYLLSNTKTLLSTVLQGVYQSMQATAASVQVNNINLILGLIGMPGSGILQMNGQPTSQNTRETGADGDLPGFRNWHNKQHIQELAEIWNVDQEIIPQWAPPTHALQIFRYAETGSIKMLWISATNPAVSMPDLPRIRKILTNTGLFVVVQDAFMTETAQMADVILPAAIWGEKTGTFTNTDRTVHITHKAVDPPGIARSDFDIFVDYAKRMDFKDKDNNPLIKWDKPEQAFEGWKKCSKGRPCDYSGMSYEMLSHVSGIQWPCNDDHPNGTERLYTDHLFPTDWEYAESYGHDLLTGGEIKLEEYKAISPAGKAILKPAEYRPPHEVPDNEYPYMLTTGRIVYHFHTRTKTARAVQLQEAAPESFIQISKKDAKELNIKNGDLLRITSRRGVAYEKAIIGDIEPGHLFIPFHYGYWDKPERPRAANELTIFEWDSVSKQPHFKYSAVKIDKSIDGEKVQPEIEEQGGLKEKVKSAAKSVEKAIEPERQHVTEYIALLHGSEQGFADALADVAEHHKMEPDIYNICLELSSISRKNVNELKKFIDKYGEHSEAEPNKMKKALYPKLSKTGFGMLRDLHDLWLFSQEAYISLVVLDQAAKALRDKELENILSRIMEDNSRQRSWLDTRIRQASPQTLTVPQ